ncbi:DUF2189 domain-containing protein [Curvibacter sp. HBC28]|uniref:DUF2189 domain-containing protein n=1 Tax=Curvibacter microcysteis TaxID=3026419 RepID=A0ABT5MEC1_9BURK|nr:DUF2189 domain-containing protein [Curvibacter sp. HBC28]MDD0814925.1 DUF2189 domain-containing protein [Curvibacter sp. HBC28]
MAAPLAHDPVPGASVPPNTPESGHAPDSAEASRLRLAPLHFSDPWRWLARGAADLIAAPGIALFYGVCFWGMALLLGWVFRSNPEYTMSIASGCLLLGPFLAMGLYDASRRRELGLKPELGRSIVCWDQHMGSMAMLVLVLMVLELIWGRASLVVFAVFFNTGMPSTTGVIQAVFNPENWEFVAVYTVVGGIFASLVFSIAVVSIPMILDRDTDAITAAITSIRVVLGHTGVMLFWGALITVLVALALWPWGLGLVLLGPWLGHATWHAYRGAVQWPGSSPASPEPTSTQA